MSDTPTRPASAPGTANGANGAAARCDGIDCAAAMRQLWDYLDGELTPERVTQVRAHLEGCRSCHPHFDFERAFLDALAATRDDAPAPGDLKARVVSALRAAGLGKD